MTASRSRRNQNRERSPDRQFAISLGRASGGAIIFGLPMLMTMEMWSRGAMMSSLRLALLIVAWLPLLVGLSSVAGFERTSRRSQDVLDAFVALAVGMVTASLVLGLLGVIRPGMSLRSATGMIALQALPGSMGALLAVSQLHTGSGEEGVRPERTDSWAGELFVMAVGALFLAFNIAPTEEITLIGLKMARWQAALTVVVSLGLMHAFVYAVEFSGQAQLAEGTAVVSVFVRYTVVGYALVLLLSGYTLWSFGRLDGIGPAETLALTVTLGFPAAIGAAAARLLL